ncbi:MAG: TadE/TadG family type IV pilus assembly protein [Gammaproteobacteria bacterium]|jgi:Flp pilus assembly protein TadG
MNSSILKDNQGSSAIQFGFVAPILILLSLGIIDMGRLGFAATTVRNAAMEAARYASLRGSDSPTPATEAAIIAVAKNEAIGIPESDLSVAVTWTPNNNSGSQVKVQLTYPIDLFISGLFPIPDVTLSRSSAMMVF